MAALVLKKFPRHRMPQKVEDNERAYVIKDCHKAISNTAKVGTMLPSVERQLRDSVDNVNFGTYIELIYLLLVCVVQKPGNYDSKVEYVNKYCEVCRNGQDVYGHDDCPYCHYCHYLRGW